MQSADVQSSYTSDDGETGGSSNQPTWVVWGPQDEQEDITQQTSIFRGLLLVAKALMASPGPRAMQRDNHVEPSTNCRGTFMAFSFHDSIP